MPDVSAAPPDDRVETALASVDWRTVTKRLTAFALRGLGRRGTIADAEEIAQDAISHLFDVRYQRWDPAIEPDVQRFLGKVVSGLLANRRDSRRVQKESPYDHETLARSAAPILESPESLATERDRAERIVASLRERLASSDTVAHEILSLTEEGIDTLAEQMSLTGRTHAEIRNARRRLHAHVDEVTSEIDGDHDGRH